MKKLIAIIALNILVLGASAQEAFSWYPNDTINTNLEANNYTELKIEQINETNDTLILGIEIVENSIPESWDGMVCVHGRCLGYIPPIGTTVDVMPIHGSTNSYVRLTVNPFDDTQVASIRIRVYDTENPADGDTATWILNNLPLSVEELSMQNSLTLYPNPVSEVLNINTTSNIDKVTIFNSIGQSVYSEVNTGKTSLPVNVANLKSGVYSIEVVLADGSILVEKLLIE